ncbi:MAG: hypothetical protein PHY93_15210 [Bacteriovorax sp.]|nr:hypothetical protein [Bacteriovorax sp.]
MLQIFLVTLFFSSSLFAIDCNGINNGEEIRLDIPGKSLETFKTQDQDGLGTCAANATSLLLHSLLPNNPDISYLQLASIYHQEDLNTKRDDARNKNEFEVYAKKIVTANGAAVASGNSLEIAEMNRWQLGIDSANICSIIEKAKGYQKSLSSGICRSNTVTLERLAGGADRDWKQKKSLLAISKYMNEFQKKFSVAKKYSKEEVKNNNEARFAYIAFQNALDEQIKNKEIIFGKKCQSFSPEMLWPVLKSMNYEILRYQDCLVPGKENYSPCNIFSKILSVTKRNDGTMNVDYRPEFVNSLLEILKQSKDPAPTTDITANIYQAIQTTTKSPIDKFGEKAMKEILATITPNSLTKLADEMKEIATTGFSKKCNERELMDYLVSNEFKLDAKNDEILCQSMGLVENVKDVISSTAQTDFADLDKVRTFLLKDANLNFDEVIKNLYAFDCLPSDKIQIPDGVSCTKMGVNRADKNKINAKILNELKNNRAVGGNICASIISKPRSQFIAGECGAHAIGLVGVKCVNGAMKYLVKNSWGIRDRAKNPALTNITDGTGQGSFWFDEQNFFDGFQEIYTMGIK